MLNIANDFVERRDENIQQNENASNSLKPENSNLRECVVCLDKSSGVHFGVVACEDCKTFFEQSITKHPTYACCLGKQCAMTSKRRKDCQYCRWMACLNAGMTYEGK